MKKRTNYSFYYIDKRSVVVQIVVIVLYEGLQVETDQVLYLIVYLIKKKKVV